MPPPSRADLEAEGVQVVEERGPSLLLDDTVLVSGQTERITEFEMGVPSQQARTGGGWEPDPWVWDDQSVIVKLAGKGLLVLSGCSHSGAVNVLRKSTPIVTYCAGPTCPNSRIAAERLAALGYVDVRAYEGGKEEWIGAGLPVDSHQVRRRAGESAKPTEVRVGRAIPKSMGNTCDHARRLVDGHDALGPA